MGVASAIRGDLLKHASARARLESDGRLTVELAMTDIGTGTYTILTQIAAETMDLPVDRVTVRLGDTNFPPTDGSGGSWGAATSGAAVLAACRKLKAGLGSGITEAEGSVTPAELDNSYAHDAFGAHFAEVGVDRDTGEVRVRRMLGVFAAGRILNAKTARSQMIGGMTWGIGSALMEGNQVDLRYGSFINQDLASYHVVVNADIGAIDAVLLDEADPHGSPLGSKGLASSVSAGRARPSSTPSITRPARASAISPPRRTSCFPHSKRWTANWKPPPKHSSMSGKRSGFPSNSKRSPSNDRLLMQRLE